ncbi:MAG: 2Fe-2S iron-sulfur cluster-binding protein [Geminicoccaceae bacterium]
MLIQGLGILVLSAILCHVLVWVVRQRAEVRAVDQIATGELTYLQRLTEEAEARARTHIERTNLLWAGWRKFRVLAVMDETEAVKSFYLAPHDKKPLPSFLPGQHVAVQVKSPDRRDPIIRCYSLSCAPNDEFYRISVKREGPSPERPAQPAGLMSSHLHSSLEEGDFVDVKSPSGAFSLDLSQHTPIVLIGGGIGITPVFSMLDSVVAQRSGREIWFFLGVRNRSEHALRVQLEALADRYENLHLMVCYSEPSNDCKLGRDYHRHGFVSVDLLRSMLPSNNYDFYFCGPPGMMNSLHEGLSAWGVPADRLHFEAFGPATVGKSVKPSVDSERSESFQIKFMRSDKTLNWEPTEGSLLDLADRHGISVESGCRSGNCGTCMTAIRTGEVDYPTPPGEMPDDGACLLCTAIPRSDLELDA